MEAKTRTQIKLEAIALVNEAIDLLDTCTTESEDELVIAHLSDATALIEDLEVTEETDKMDRRRANFIKVQEDIKKNF